ncbi:small capsid protein [Rhinolophus gammaherpesvirus 1]|uniref:Small capsid protein n=1 Tax=Rhinolophus gammaherpesvirus 1 TaxID=2054179 RepID=A0A2Z5U664_9GAMA|nr:small capsid protein [Rhinolophus gammaherpesvirus 1]BBB06518.1 small capsid protein [Rhinolophus gammaherpesvirus 1]
MPLQDDSYSEEAKQKVVDRARGGVLKMPDVQDKLEDSDSNPEVAKQLKNFQKSSLNNEQLEQAKKLYVCYLRAQEIYEEQAQKRLGIRRKKHLADVSKAGHSGPGGSLPSSIFSSTTPTSASFTVLPSDSSSDLASQPKLKAPHPQTTKGKK